MHNFFWLSQDNHSTKTANLDFQIATEILRPIPGQCSSSIPPTNFRKPQVNTKLCGTLEPQME